MFVQVKKLLNPNSTSAMAHAHALAGLGIVDLALEIQEEDPIKALGYPLDSLRAIAAGLIGQHSVTGSRTLTVATVKLDPMRALEYPLIHVIVAARILHQFATDLQTLIATIVWRTIKMF